MSVSKSRFVGRELLLTIVLHWLLKKLRKLAFAKKPVTGQLPIDSGGIRGILEKFLRLTNRFYLLFYGYIYATFGCMTFSRLRYLNTKISLFKYIKYVSIWPLPTKYLILRN